jgi:autotransporter-associated beta strand protein
MKRSTPLSSIPLVDPRFRFLVPLLLASLCGSPGNAATVTLQQGRSGYTGTTDAWLNESSSYRDNNYGGDTELRIKYDGSTSGNGFNEDHTILKFALPSLSYSSVSTATLELYYFEANSFQSDNAMGIKPYRVSTAKPWYENTGIALDGQGVNFKYIDQGQSVAWTSQNGGWEDKIDDGNSSNKIKKTGGDPTDAVPPLNWVPFDVRPSVQQWYGGQANNGLLLFSSSFEGGGTTLYGKFYSRDYLSDSGLRPRLTLTFAGAGITWAGGVNGTWDTSTANWSVGGYAGTYGNSDNVTFPNGAGNPTLTVTGGGVSPGSVAINNSSTTYAFSGGAIGGSGGLTKSGTGSATLSAGNTYAGSTAINGGVLQIRHANALGTTAGGTTVADGARLELASGIAVGAETLTLNGNGGGSGALRSVNGDNSWAGNITLGAAAEIQVDAASLTLGGNLDGSAVGLTSDGAGATTVNGEVGSGITTLAKSGSGTLTLAHANAHTGATTVGSGVLRITQGNALGATAAGTSVTSGARLEFQGDLANAGEALTLNGDGAGSGALRHVSGNTTWNGAIGLGSNAEIQADAGILTLGGGINAGAFALTVDGAGTVRLDTVGLGGVGGSLVKSGAGTLILNAAGSFSGICTMGAGTVTLGADSALGTVAGGTTVQSGAMLQLAGGLDYATAEPLSLAGTGIGGLGALYAATGINRFAGPISLDGSTSIGVATGAKLTIDNSLGGGSALTKTGPGELVLAAASSYLGNTTVQAGTLSLTGAGSLGGGPGIAVSAGATLDVSGRTDGALDVGPAQTLSGSGRVLGKVVLDGTIAPGASPGRLQTGEEAWNVGGSYTWEIRNATGVAGVDWDLVEIGGDLHVNATQAAPFKVWIGSAAGPVLNFNYDSSYNWTIAAVSGSTTGFDLAKFALDTLGFLDDTAGGAFTLASGSIQVVFTPNHAPLASAAEYYRRTNTALKINIPRLLATYTSDPDGDPRDLFWFSPLSNNGVPITRRGDYLCYETADNRNDSLVYVVRDVRPSYRPWDSIRTGAAAIRIRMLDDNNASPNILGLRIVGDVAELTIAGIPNFSYAVQRTTDLTPPIDWEYVGSQVAPPQGVFVFQDTHPPFPPSPAYYRTVEE